MAFGGISPPDPFLLYDTVLSNWPSTLTYRVTAGRTARSATIDTGVKNLICLVAGQSLLTNVSPTIYTAANASAIDNLNIYDGQLYDPGGPLLGCAYANHGGGFPSLGPGNVMLRVADTLVANAKFARVILVPLTIGNTSIAQWGDVGAIHANRTVVAMGRLAARGIVPGMTNVTFADVMAVGHKDHSDGTAQAAWQASYGTYQTTLRATGFNGRSFVCLESASGQTSNNTRSAQAAVVNGSTIFSGGDIDSNTIATSDGTHPSDAGAATMATIIYNALVASGAPF